MEAAFKSTFCRGAYPTQSKWYQDALKFYCCFHGPFYSGYDRLRFKNEVCDPCLRSNQFHAAIHRACTLNDHLLSLWLNSQDGVALAVRATAPHGSNPVTKLTSI